jgi:3-dehydroquinate dehydratase-2
MATILLLSGPNLNLLGERQPLIYGTSTLADLVGIATAAAAEHGHTVEHVQSNHEGALIEAIHWAREHAAAVVINAAAFTHSSYALADALMTFDGVKVELHISNPLAREPWRRRSVLAPHVTGTIAGFGPVGYRLAIQAVAAALAEAPS